MPPRKKTRQVADIMLPVKSAELAKILEAGIDYHSLTINVNFSGLHASEFKLGDFAVTIQGTLHDLVCEDPIYLYFRRFSLFCMLVWNEYDNNLVLREKFAYASCDVPREVLLNLLDAKAFRIVLNPANVQLASSTLILEVYLTDNVILSLKSPSEILFSRSVENINGAVKHFKNIEYVNLEDRLCPKQSTLKILDNIQNSFAPKNELQIFSQYLIPRLRHYQSQAVHWMLKQEEVRVHTKIHPLYTELELKENTKIYYQKYNGFFVKEKYIAEKPLGGILADEMGLGKTIEILALILKHRIPSARLEENLALFLDSVSKRSTHNTLCHRIGKKIPFNSLSEIYFECTCGGSYESSDEKMMAQCKNCSLIQHTECILYNTDVTSYDYLCPYCWVDPSQELLLSRGTVIISPASILYQWQQEIAKHVKENTLKVFVYRGVEQHKFINPQDLADHDIILISYEVLRRELGHLNVPHGASRRALRYPQKFSVIPSPLSAIKWWRICLDEAQMVEGVTSKIAEMALQLHTINRWCVTGTPIQKSVKDIYGLLLFLKYDPYDSRQWFRELLWKPLVNGNIDPMISVLNQVMWRTSKKDVIEQLGIPMQETVIHKLQLSQVEKVFYETQREKCKNDFMENIKKYHCVAHAQLSRMDRCIVAKIMLPLKNLQRACCHHQLVRDTFVDVQKCNISMSALLNHLLQKSLNECEEAHRAALCAMNGLAGIYTLREDYESACKMYKKILASIEEYSANVRTDPLQHIHVLYNFSNLVLSLEKEVVASTSGLTEILQNVNCEEMKSKYNLLCENYVRRHREGLHNYWDSNSHIRCEVEVSFTVFKNGKRGFTESSWWYEIFRSLSEKERQTLTVKVKEMLTDTADAFHVKGLPSVAHRFCEESGFIITLLRLSEELYQTRAEAFDIVRLCVCEVNPDYVNVAKDCHLRPLQGIKSKCLLCKADAVLKRYESKLYRIEETTEEPEETTEEPEMESKVCFRKLRQGNHSDSEYELILKFIMTHCRPFKGVARRVQDGVKELKLLEAMKKEFKVLQTAWIKASEYIAAVDELEMAKMSMKTLKETEPMAKCCVSKLIPTGRGNDNDELQYKSDVTISENILRKKLGQLYYLQNLKRAESHEVHPFDQTCPVCVTKLTDTWCVLHCGHCFCLTCVQMVGKYSEAHAKDLSCPVCRSLTPRSEIYSVDRQAAKDDDEIEIKGRYSSKIHGVLKCLLEIRKQNSRAKTIVFSSWKDFLLILETALIENSIKYVSLCNRSPNTFESYLPRFKSSSEENVLLLPLKVGANGMNITEATNVIIIEPVLDYSQIRQAIGRVYRMGQTERTFVHMFYVADTVEESIFNMNASLCVEDEMLETVNDLKKLFG